MTELPDLAKFQCYLEMKARADGALADCLPHPPECPERVCEAMRYAAEGGKRVRPVLMLLIADLLNKEPQRVLYATCSIECIHLASLALDDLPCMDDAEERRGRPALHRRFGEATALLAAYAFVMRAFEWSAKNLSENGTAAGRAAEVIGAMASCAGVAGMVGGQSVDLALNRDSSASLVDYACRHKTASLFAGAAEIAALLCGAAPQQVRALAEYADCLGIAFQITDDLRDSEVTNAEISPVSILGPQRARDRRDECVAKAISSLQPFGERAGELRRLARLMTGE